MVLSFIKYFFFALSICSIVFKITKQIEIRSSRRCLIGCVTQTANGIGYQSVDLLLFFTAAMPVADSLLECPVVSDEFYGRTSQMEDFVNMQL